LTRYFQTFYLKRQGIEHLDQHIENFTNLQILNLSFNKLETLEFLPPNLKELHVAANQITCIEPTSVVKSLIHLGLAYNKITDS
jgi:Leucine-rich repeat (LRR) protein